MANIKMVDSNGIWLISNAFNDSKARRNTRLLVSKFMLFQVWILKFLSIAIDAAYCNDENYMILFPTGPVFEGENEYFVGPIF